MSEFDGRDAGWWDMYEFADVFEQHVMPKWEVHNASMDCSCCPVEVQVDSATGFALIKHNEWRDSN